MTRRAAAHDAVPLVARVFAKLSDGEFHSGEELARTLGVTRSAVWKAANALRDLGTPMEAVRNRGYRLVAASEPLVATRIRDQLSRTVRERIERLDVAWSLASTNTELVSRPNPPLGRTEVLLAEFQTAGRGRRGRAWFAPPGGAVCLSLSWTFPDMPRDAGALGLAIGVCVLRALEPFGVPDVRLKWPNDVLVADRKLGGILIELRAESDGPACAVVGIGLNVALGADLLQKIAALGLPATDLVSVTREAGSRNALTASLIESCVRGLLEFEQEGLRPFIDEWRHADALRGRPVTVQAGEETARGLARSIDLAGALLIETPHGLKKFFSGEVTVRPE
ncbi:MAG TPA: biotin--[acetyl-CoA-carboxylase] ligase [Steroidobacteraceae bacterium]|nr:biotin--[acetyl-CoA-carboxylase] ligase [Steroidobacteraceae bacterium]